MQLLKPATLAACAIAASCALWLRLSMLGGPPFTDGGTYHYNAWLAAHIGGSLPTAPLNAYSWLASLCGQPADAPFAPARALDASALAAAAAALAWLLRRCRAGWATAAVLASLWAVLWSTPVFADSGFKNPIAAACLPLFVSLGLLLGPRPWPLAAGAIAVAACMLREAFAPLVVLLPIAAWLRHGGRAATRLVAGGALGGAIGLLWMLAAGIAPITALDNLRAAARNANGLLAATGTDPGELRTANLMRMLAHCWFVLWWPAVALVLARWRSPLRRLRRGPLLATFALLLLPLPEVFGKFCLPYHWLQLAPAALIPAALADRRMRALTRLHRGPRGLRIGAWLAFAVVLIGGSGAMRRELSAGLDWHRTFGPVMLRGDWEHAATGYNRFLQIARWLRENTRPDQTLLVSGYGYVVYPLADRRPASTQVSDLTFSRMTGQPEHHPEWLQALRTNPPDFVLETLRWPEPLQTFWPDFANRYELAHEWSLDDGVHYGNFAARLWRLR